MFSTSSFHSLRLHKITLSPLPSWALRTLGKTSTLIKLNPTLHLSQATDPSRKKITTTLKRYHLLRPQISKDTPAIYYIFLVNLLSFFTLSELLTPFLINWQTHFTIHWEEFRTMPLSLHGIDLSSSLEQTGHFFRYNRWPASHLQGLVLYPLTSLKTSLLHWNCSSLGLQRPSWSPHLMSIIFVHVSAALIPLITPSFRNTTFAWLLPVLWFSSHLPGSSSCNWL